MSCENVQELTSLLLDRNIPAGERGNLLAHVEACAQCRAHLEATQHLRKELRAMSQAAVPAALTTRLSVMASHERQRRLTHTSLGNRLQAWAGQIQLSFDNLMRPFALPVAGGLLSAVALFSMLVPCLTFRHDFIDESFLTDPDGQVVVLDARGRYVQASVVEPQIEPVYSENPADANVVWLAIDENGKVSDYSVASGQLTPDIKNIIMFSQFRPATFLGIPTTGVVKMVQRAPARRSLRS